MKMENYAFVRVACSNGKVSSLSIESDNSHNPENSKFYVALLGEVYGREGTNDGTLICTAAIKEITEDGKAMTYSGSTYELGEKHSDYIAFEKAVNDGMPILECWGIGKISGSEDLYIQGRIGGTKLQKKITSHDGAVITLYDGSKCFVDWIRVRGVMQLNIQSGVVNGRKFCSIGFQPDISANNWDFNEAGDIMYDLEFAKAQGYIV